MKKKEKINVTKSLLAIDDEIDFLKEMRRRIKEIGKGNYFTLDELLKTWKDPTKCVETLRKEEWKKAMKKAKGDEKKAMEIYCED